MSSITNTVITGFTKSVSNFMTGNSKSATEKKIELGSKLSILLEEYKENIEIPKIVVVGTQSSGKTSILNGIIGLPILPTGNSITTRTPLHIELVPILNPNESCVIINKQKIDINPKSYTKQDMKKIADVINVITNEYTNNTLNISSKPIYITVKYSNLPHIFLIDLPGLTLVARTDEGQPKDIKKQIRDLVSSYISSTHTYILAIIAAREDIETDMALELIKEYDHSLNRTMGILTKVDLMNSQSSISQYIEGDMVSIDLRMKYDYIAVRNFKSEQHIKEEDFFKNHPIYSSLFAKYPESFTIKSVTNKSISILDLALCIELPKIEKKIKYELQNIEKELQKFPQSINPSEYSTRLFSIISSVCIELSKQINGRGIYSDTGRIVKKILIDYRNEIGAINSLKDYSKTDIKEIIEKVEGNHMSVSIPSIQIIEYILMSADKNPIDFLYIPSMKVIDKITFEIKKLAKQIINSSPHLHSFINCKEAILKYINEFIDLCMGKTKDNIKNILEHQKCYVWTDDVSFSQSIAENIEKNNNIYITTKNMFETYYSTIIFQCQEYIPKCIMYNLVLACSKIDIQDHIYNNILHSYSNNMTNLFNIPSSIEYEKKKLIHQKEIFLKSEKIIKEYISLDY